jgi:hypothetical protein
MLRDFVEAAVLGEPERMLKAIEELEFAQVVGWADAMRAISRRGSVPNRTRQFFLRAYVKLGDHIRQETGDDLALIRGLRVLLPRYRGPAVRLYRGEGALKPRSRSYVLSWTADRVVAEDFARNQARNSGKKSVVLETFAPTEPIICRVHGLEEHYGQIDEYIVDRRRLHRVISKPQTDSASG